MAETKVTSKKVNIYPKAGPIITVAPPIRSQVVYTTKKVEDILKCINAGAIVEEVLADGSTIKLTHSNYDVDNSGSVETKKVPITDNVVLPDGDSETQNVHVAEVDKEVDVNEARRDQVERYDNKKKKKNKYNQQQQQQNSGSNQQQSGQNQQQDGQGQQQQQQDPDTGDGNGNE